MGLTSHQRRESAVVGVAGSGAGPPPSSSSSASSSSSSSTGSSKREHHRSHHQLWRTQPAPLAAAAGWFASLRRPTKRRARSGSCSSAGAPAHGRLLARSAWDLSASCLGNMDPPPGRSEGGRSGSSARGDGRRTEATSLVNVFACRPLFRRASGAPR